MIQKVSQIILNDLEFCHDLNKLINKYGKYIRKLSKIMHINILGIKPNTAPLNHGLVISDIFFNKLLHKILFQQQQKQNINHTLGIHLWMLQVEHTQHSCLLVNQRLQHPTFINYTISFK
jgi:hypothetical protein